MTPELQAGYTWEAFGFTIKVVKPESHYIEYEIFTSDGRSIANGTVKWDHCSNWSFPTYYHGCDEEMLLNFGKVLSACWKHTEKFLPTWDVI